SDVCSYDLFQRVILFGKILLIWYLLVFSLSFVTTSDTTADFTDLKEGRGMIYAAGDWKVVDESALVFIENDAQEWNTCDPKALKTTIENNGVEDMQDNSTYAVRSEEHTSELQSRFDIVCCL